MIFISQPISAQPRIRKLLDDLQDTTASVYFLPDVYVFDLMQARFDNVGRHAGGGDLRNPVHGHQQHGQARQRHRVRRHHPAVGAAA